MAGMKKAVFFLSIILCLASLPALSFAQDLNWAEAEIADGLDSLANFEGINFYVKCYGWQGCPEEERLLRDFSFINDPTLIEFEAALSNPFDSNAEFYLAKREGGEWKVLGLIAAVEPKSDINVVIPLEFSYAEQSSEKDEIAIVGISREGKVKNSFLISEDWKPYEALGINLLFFGVPIAMVIGAILVLFVGATTAFVFLGRRRVKGREYTLQGLLIPSIKGMELKEMFSLLLLHPLFWLFEFACGCIIILLILIFTLSGMSLGPGLLVFLIGGVFAVAAPVAYLFIAWLIDWYEREPLRFIVSIFFWGIFAAFISFFANTIIGLAFNLLFGITLGDAGLLISAVIGTVIVAPVVEETAKGLGVLILSAHSELNDVLDGILYGFGVGMGFAFIENWLYFTSANPAVVGGLAGWAFLIFNRSLVCALGHGLFTGSTGGIIAFLKGLTGKHSYLYFIPAVAVAMLLHGIFNLVAYIDGLIGYFLGIPVPIFDSAGILALAGIFSIIVFFQLLKNREEFFRLEKGRKEKKGKWPKKQ